MRTDAPTGDGGLPSSVLSRAPTRIDLAGGTVDIWPLYLLLDQPLTINLGIDLFAEARIEWSDSGPAGLQLVSEDQGTQAYFPWPAVAAARAEPSLELPLKLVRYAWKNWAEQDAYRSLRMTLKTRAKSPAGAGLGGSSTLSISILSALWNCFTGETDADESTRLRWVEIARDIETTVIQVPAGMQDYYGAAFGGVQAIHWDVQAHRREELPGSLTAALERRLLLFYSGQSRNSGINNWSLFQSFINRDVSVRQRFEGIVQATRDLRSALLAQDWKAAGAAIRSEWAFRRQLAAGISTPEIDAALESGMKAGASAAKICGAGGGGCFFVFLEADDAGLRSRVREAVLSAGGSTIRALDFRASKDGARATALSSGPQAVAGE